MVRKSYGSELKSRHFVKVYSKRTKTLLNAKFMHHLINPNDIASTRIVAYEKTTEDKLASLTCFLQFISLTNGMSLRYMSFALCKKISQVDATSLAIDQLDLEEALDEYGFIKL